ncbi:hypothetical protein ACOSQ2_029568 [Xanthoceras sorbifolium]
MHGSPHKSTVEFPLRSYVEASTRGKKGLAYTPLSSEMACLPHISPLEATKKTETELEDHRPPTSNTTITSPISIPHPDNSQILIRHPSCTLEVGLGKNIQKNMYGNLQISASFNSLNGSATMDI